MKELEFLEKINDLDPALLEDRPAPVRRAGTRADWGARNRASKQRRSCRW